MRNLDINDTTPTPSLASVVVNNPFQGWLASVIAVAPQVTDADNAPPLPAPRVLAHLGDALYELLLRQWLLSQPTDWNSTALHEASTHLARMETQANLMEQLLPTLTPAEVAVFKAGRNQPIPTSRRKHQVVYRLATGFEALLGYWWLHTPAKLACLEPLLEL